MSLPQLGEGVCWDTETFFWLLHLGGKTPEDVHSVPGPYQEVITSFTLMSASLRVSSKSLRGQTLEWDSSTTPRLKTTM